MPAIELKLKATTVAALLVFHLLAVPALSRGRLSVKSKNKNNNMGSEVYEIDYRGPETHTYIPPPNRAGDRPRIHHKASMARRKKSKPNKGRRNL